MAAVKVSAWPQFFRDIVPLAMLGSLTVDEVCDRLRGELSDCSGVLIFDSGSCVAGYVMYGASRDSGRGTEMAGEIMQLYVDPAFVGAGRGRRLALKALEHLSDDGFAAARAWCFEKNKRGRRFYESLGFRLDGGLKTETIGGADIRVVRYRKQLESA